jgi:hypothetical protein
MIPHNEIRAILDKVLLPSDFDSLSHKSKIAQASDSGHQFLQFFFKSYHCSQRSLFYFMKIKRKIQKRKPSPKERGQVLTFNILRKYDLDSKALKVKT